MEITKIEDIKKEIGNQVKWACYHQLPEGLVGTELGILKSIESVWITTVEGDKCIDYKCEIEIEKDSIKYTVYAKRIFTVDEKDDIVTNIAITEKIVELQKQITALESQKVESIGVIKK